MPSKLDFTLTDDELSVVEEAIRRDKRPEVRRKATALRWLHLGHPVSEVARLVLVSEATIYNWVGGWRKAGLEGLARRRGSGPKPKADEAYCLALEAALDQEPQALGYPFAIWTLERLRDHLQRQTGVRLSLSRLRVVLKERGYVYRRPKHDLTNLQDVQAREQVQALLDELKRGRSTVISGFSLWTKAPSASTRPSEPAG
jgi:transposase